MTTFELMLRVDLAKDPDSAAATHSDEAQRVRVELYRALGLQVRSHAWVTLKLGTPKADRALAAFIEERAAGRSLVGAAQLSESPAKGEDEASDWHLLWTRQVYNSFSLWDTPPRCTPGTLPKVHALNHTFVSTQFKSAYERAGLNGLQFLQCANKGRKPGDPWFVALPEHNLGNGLDHPWFDRARWVSHVGGNPNKRSSAIGVGQNAFKQFWLRPAATQDPFVAGLLKVCPMPAKPIALDGLTFVMVPRYLRRAEPSEDFAYVPWGEDGANRLGKTLRHRQLMVRRRARDALVAAGLFKEREFLRVWSVTKPEPGVEVLDDRYEAAGPMYTDDELAALTRSPDA